MKAVSVSAIRKLRLRLPPGRREKTILEGKEVDSCFRRNDNTGSIGVLHGVGVKKEAK
ncbi:MAG: hypothetical protein KAY65_00110 [Planctomycetes bacterium]|nr:hypothetical protein [Planctomycetota bacterium]